MIMRNFTVNGIDFDWATAYEMYKQFELARLVEDVALVCECNYDDVTIPEEDARVIAEKLFNNLEDYISEIIMNEVRDAVEKYIVRHPNWKVGDKVRICDMRGEPDYKGRVGVVTYIDSIGQLHGTWGGLAVVPNEDKIDYLGHEE